MIIRKNLTNRLLFFQRKAYQISDKKRADQKIQKQPKKQINYQSKEEKKKAEQLN